MQLIMKAALRVTLIIYLVLPAAVGAETVFDIPIQPENLGGFNAVPVVDRGVIAAANFAVNTRPVTLIDIVVAKQQLVDGKTYALCLRVKSKIAKAPSRLIMTKIFKPFGEAYQLKSWTRVNSCSFNG
ncbi:hypothetical protein [Asticcacaulis sp.]|uniref:hypothetical protein n=1 Tax=Asticcacaulis sp. TaxID=1872648 RepID=UPI002B83686E|nr:hypothetical protein [Asticcacaulis sp.]HTM81858.1 hypothetical protein [Asticcacaulis sp.]